MSTSINSPANYLHSSGLTELKRQVGDTENNDAIKEVAKQFEAMFVQTMMKNMRSATFGDPLFGSDAQDQYRDLADKQMALDLTSSGKGFGIAALVEKQIRQQQGISSSDCNLNSNSNSKSNTNSAGEKGEFSIRRFYGEAKMPFNSKDFASSEIERTSSTKESISAKSVTASGGKHQIFETPEQFVKQVWTYAEKAAERLGVDPKVIVAQAALETGWGKHVIASDSGDGGYNFFGIKANNGWEGNKVRVGTLEYEKGAAIRKNEEFRCYDSVESGFNDYIDFLENNSRYSEVLKNADDPIKFSKELQKAGYATDPNYSEKIIKVMNSAPINSAARSKESNDSIARISNLELKNG